MPRNHRSHGSRNTRRSSRRTTTYDPTQLREPSTQEQYDRFIESARAAARQANEQSLTVLQLSVSHYLVRAEFGRWWQDSSNRWSNRQYDFYMQGQSATIGDVCWSFSNERPMASFCGVAQRIPENQAPLPDEDGLLDWSPFEEVGWEFLMERLRAESRAENE